MSCGKRRDDTIWVQTVIKVTRNAIVARTVQNGDTHEAKLGIFTALPCRISNCQVGLVISIGSGDHVGGFDGATILGN